jgi:signal transduction histidine kinase/CheY-like chemotaxis protein
MPTPSDSSDPHVDRIHVEQIAALYQNAAVGPFGALAAAVILAAALFVIGDLPWLDAAAWIGWGVGCVSFHMILRHLYSRARDKREAWRRWGHWFTSASLMDGLWWAYGTTLLVAPQLVEGQLLASTVATGVAVGAALAYGSYPPAFQAVFFPITTLALIWNLFQRDTLHLAVAALIAVFMVTMNVLARRAYANSMETLRTRFEKDALAEDLRRQKEVAEEANLSKSRFLAAASHDLRQPTHALGMFVGALARHPMSEEMRRLVEQIEGSVGAMDGLFNSLLDISKLDAGVVQSHVRTFPIGPLLDRICSEFAGEARRKGLRFTLCPCSAFVVSDLVLLERILRNVVSNAVRYTDRGRILVGCRRGSRLSIEIWDTGRGIAQGDRERVFQEFYQVDNFERDRGKGLGLGLAIVRRLTLLLDHPLELRSQVGKGSVFRLSLPTTDAEMLSFVPPSADPIFPALQGALILVVDDELMVQEAMSSLLKSWGSDVIVASSCAEMLERIEACVAAPDFILCDYRLPGEENGIDVIRRLQAEFNEDIPAILITGDTAPDRLQQAHDSGFVVLAKPVANSKLRATIGNLMKRGVPDATETAGAA